MNILINTSNLKTGGGVQVADSICRNLYMYSKHNFTVVLCESLKYLEKDLEKMKNVEVYNYTQSLSINNVFTGRDRFLDKLVKIKSIDSVLTVFGPSRWNPRCHHIAGFAMPHVVLPESPFWNKISNTSRFIARLRVLLMKRDFKINNNVLWCENEYISEKLRKLFTKKEVHTVTNNYNQIFNDSALWDRSIRLPKFNGLTLLTVTANYPHKNLSIALDALYIIEKLSPNLNIRFVFTIKPSEFVEIPEKFKGKILLLGPVSINQCPMLYEQADIMFQPSLLECFSATYAEAMKMGLPIITTDLGFAHSLCGEAALYYSPLDAKDLAKTIIRLSLGRELQENLIHKGEKQLHKFDTPEERVSKLISIIENHK